MDYAERDKTLDSIRLMFGAEGAIAFIDYRKGLADPADFSMNAAVLHIQDRLGLSSEQLASMATDARANQIAKALDRGIDLCALPVDAGPLDDLLDRLATEPPETSPGRF